MLIAYLLYTVLRWSVGTLTMGAVAWLYPVIIILVILSVLGVKVGKFWGAVLKGIGNGMVSIATWAVGAIPKLFKQLYRFYIFLSKRCFHRMPRWAAAILTIAIIAII